MPVVTLGRVVTVSFEIPESGIYTNVKTRALVSVFAIN